MDNPPPTPPPPSHRALAAARRHWRRGLRARWRTVRGPVLLAIGLGSLVLGTIGYLQLRSVTPRYGFLDALYRAMTLFVFGGSATPPVPPTLQIARIGAPLLTGYAAIGAVLTLFREQARVLGIRLFVRRHVIIAGLGGTGHRLAEALVDHQPVVVVEHDPAAPHLTAAQLRGVRTLIGDATEATALHRAGLRHASALVVTCGSGATNVDVAATAASSGERRRLPLSVFLHLRDVDLWSSLAAEGATFREERTDVRLEYFNVLAAGAQLLLEREPPFAPGGPAHPHVLIVGIEGVGEQLVLALVRAWRATGATDPLAITITGSDAARDVAELQGRHGALAQLCRLKALPLAVASSAFAAGAAMTIGGGQEPVTRAYVSLLDEGDALVAALALHARPAAAHVPVTVAVADAGAGASVILGSERGRFANIRSFGVLSEAVGHHLLLRGTNELLARAQHAQWLRAQLARGVTVAENPNLKPWDELDEEGRERNRRFADDLHAKLTLIDCMLVPVPLPEPGRPRFQFTADELDRLARHEHRRWEATMRETGWRYGPVRNDAARIHDQLKPWEELDEPNRDKDREAVLEIPRMLEAAGFEIRRRDARRPAGTSGS